ncbi:MAG TPA: hypothetical protein PK250_13860 [Syntrophobacter fumaroxidans]|nr:hypothetical protein [Syntrophobacter fumaroxidans]
MSRNGNETRCPEAASDRHIGPCQGKRLGSANVRKTVEAHGGEIEALRPPGEMTRFIIRLPAEVKEEERQEPWRKPGQCTGGAEDDTHGFTDPGYRPLDG